MATLLNTLAELKEAAENSVLLRDVVRTILMVIPVSGALHDVLRGLEKYEPACVLTATVGVFTYHRLCRGRKARLAPKGGE
jgi:hypothetical protein